MSKGKSTIDNNLGAKEKASRDLRRAMTAALQFLDNDQVYLALEHLGATIQQVSKDLLYKKPLSCNPSTSDVKKLRRLKKPGTDASDRIT